MQSFYPQFNNGVNYLDKLNKLNQMQQQFNTQYPQYIPQYQTQNSSNQIVFVQGETGAKAYQIPANTTILLMSSESDEFFIKTTDAAGFPTIKRFKFQEIVNEKPVPPPNSSEILASKASEIDMSNFVSRAEFEELKEAIFNESNNANAKQASSTKQSANERTKRT